MKKTVDAFDYAGTICKALNKGILLTTRSGDRVNTMTIGWGKIGIEWGKSVFIAYVRESRFTKELLDATDEFTVNVPLTDDHKEILCYCGRKSGRDTDKIRDMQLTTVDSDVVSVPGIAQFPLTLECKIIYRQEQDLSRMTQSVTDKFYPINEQIQAPDMHTAYYGEIVNAYLIEGEA